MVCDIILIITVIMLQEKNIHNWFYDYTLFNPENDRDVTERVQEYTRQDASFKHQSRCSFLNV